MKKKKIWQGIFLLSLIVGSILILHKQPGFRTDRGFIFGTVYQITYQSDEDLKAEIEERLHMVDNSLSPFNKHSVITAVNNNDSVVLDSMFVEVFRMAEEIANQTGGAFDISVAPLVNAWGFGFKNKIEPTDAAIDSIRRFIGFDKVRLSDDNPPVVLKKDDRLMLDCGAIAKGYGVDQVAALLRERGIKNFMVDIGGEVVVSGKNPKMNKWRIGINKPEEDSLSLNNELEAVLMLENQALATSGNYRNFYYKGGKRYAHTIDPRSGKPVQHNILSASVIAPNCALADAYATSFMVMGLDSALKFCKNHREIEGYFICSGNDGKYKIVCTEGVKKLLVR